jgi:hypothetical protein
MTTKDKALKELLDYTTAFWRRREEFNPIEEAKRLELLAAICREAAESLAGGINRA